MFSDVRNFEAFKYLHIACISDLKRKSLPEIAKIVGLDNYQGLHHFLTTPSWSVEQLRALRLELILQVLKGRPIILIIDETGDKKIRFYMRLPWGKNFLYHNLMFPLSATLFLRKWQTCNLAFKLHLSNLNSD